MVRDMENIKGWNLTPDKINEHMSRRKIKFGHLQKLISEKFEN
jgi:hypothetical protein